jgi:hypothetical protein
MNHSRLSITWSLRQPKRLLVSASFFNRLRMASSSGLAAGLYKKLVLDKPISLHAFRTLSPKRLMINIITSRFALGLKSFLR